MSFSAGESAERRVVIVGGGAAGTITAVHLLRACGEVPIEIELLDRDGAFGSGVAYGTPNPSHLLNVPAVRMGAISGKPEDFFDWLQAKDMTVFKGAFLSRNLYGDYLSDLLKQASRDSVAGTVRRRHAEVTDVHLDEERIVVGLGNGESIAAGTVVVAPGPLPGRLPLPAPPDFFNSEHYVPDPWAGDAMLEAREQREVLVLGTGLSMVDACISLTGKAEGPRIRAVSRHGLLPRRHLHRLTDIRHFPLPQDSPTVEQILGAVYEEIGRVSMQGSGWRDVIDSMRPSTPAVWRSMSLPERQRFLADFQRLWDVHRFRMPPQAAERMDRLQASGLVRVEAKSILSVDVRKGRARVRLRCPGSREITTVEVDRVVNCTGAGVDFVGEPPAFLRGLLSEGAARPDDLGLGLEVDEGGALISRKGDPSRRIFAVGALRKGVEWESIGITEIRDQAALVAERVAGLLAPHGSGFDREPVLPVRGPRSMVS